MALQGEAKRAYQREWVARRRAFYVQLFGGCCSKCSSKRGLQFDHVDPNTKLAHSIFSWSHDRIRKELKKCQLLCVSCHREKTVSELKALFASNSRYTGALEFPEIDARAIEIQKVLGKKGWVDLAAAKLGLHKRTIRKFYVKYMKDF